MHPAHAHSVQGVRVHGETYSHDGACEPLTVRRCTGAGAESAGDLRRHGKQAAVAAPQRQRLCLLSGGRAVPYLWQAWRSLGPGPMPAARCMMRLWQQRGWLGITMQRQKAVSPNRVMTRVCAGAHWLCDRRAGVPLRDDAVRGVRQLAPLCQRAGAALQVRTAVACWVKCAVS